MLGEPKVWCQAPQEDGSVLLGRLIGRASDVETGRVTAYLLLADDRVLAVPNETLETLPELV